MVKRHHYIMILFVVCCFLYFYNRNKIYILPILNVLNKSVRCRGPTSWSTYAYTLSNIFLLYYTCITIYLYDRLQFFSKWKQISVLTQTRNLMARVGLVLYIYYTRRFNTNPYNILNWVPMLSGKKNLLIQSRVHTEHILTY